MGQVKLHVLTLNKTRRYRSLTRTLQKEVLFLRPPPRKAKVTLLDLSFSASLSLLSLDHLSSKSPGLQLAEAWRKNRMQHSKLR
ncbi:hypothetical protein AALP_AA6G230800 [Arabis alpina]|uniref:Uncharacterized protein n=1 Tax=Arabis alpina TaxID=50452 RepID=A0A087GR52_ARAAL|nr:hypothetical protein AALP_AA6G230800 [Arabis alpina]